MNDVITLYNKGRVNTHTQRRTISLLWLGFRKTLWFEWLAMIASDASISILTGRYHIPSGMYRDRGSFASVFKCAHNFDSKKRLVISVCPTSHPFLLF